MGEQTILYFGSFHNKTVRGHQNCLSKYPALFTTLRFVFGKLPVPQAVIEARSQLMTIQQTGSMFSYIMAIQDLNTIVRWSEQVLMIFFKIGISSEIMPFFRNLDQCQTLSDLQVAASKVYTTHTGQRIRKVRHQFAAAKRVRRTQGINDNGLKLGRRRNQTWSTRNHGQMRLPRPQKLLAFSLMRSSKSVQV